MQKTSQPIGLDRYKDSVLRRHKALDLSRTPEPTCTNGDDARFPASPAAVFAKGLAHDRMGRVRRADYQRLCHSIETATPAPADLVDAKPSLTQGRDGPWPRCRWDDLRDGHGFALQGPDAGSVSMPPAPRLGSDELIGELSELYALALVRDLPFEEARQGAPLSRSLSRGLAGLPWFDPEAQVRDAGGDPLGTPAQARRRARLGRPLLASGVYGANSGPILSQFLLRGTGGPGARPGSGVLQIGAHEMSQQVTRPAFGQDYMVDWIEWLDVQCAADTRAAAQVAPGRGFLRTPRDLAWFVRAALPFQVFVNAGHILVSEGARGVAGIHGAGMLARLAESGVQVLNAVTRQKLLHHRRPRPEAVAAALALVANTGPDTAGASGAAISRVLEGVSSVDLPSGLSLLDMVAHRNATIGKVHRRNRRLRGLPMARNILLPMAYPEGAPMSPSYGSAHAAIAGACATLLKATFRMYADDDSWVPLRLNEVGSGGMHAVFATDGPGETLVPIEGAPSLTLQGEINKLAANIGLGRMIAGVSFASDVHEGLRLGEEVAIALLHEKLMTFADGTEIRFQSFDGDRITMRAGGVAGPEITRLPAPPCRA